MLRVGSLLAPRLLRRKMEAVAHIRAPAAEFGDVLGADGRRRLAREALYRRTVLELDHPAAERRGDRAHERSVRSVLELPYLDLDRIAAAVVVADQAGLRRNRVRQSEQPIAR